MFTQSGRLIAVIMMVLGLTLSTGVGQAAFAETTYAKFGPGKKYQGGPGHAETVYAGKWTWSGKKGWCIDFERHNPDSSGTKVIGRVPGMTEDQSRRAFMIVNRYAETTSDRVAADVAFAIWHLQDGRNFNTWWRWARNNDVVSDRQAARINRILKWSKTHGPYKVHVDVKPAFYGQTTNGSVTVLAANGRPAVKMPVSVTEVSKNGRVTSAEGRTDNNGKANFTVKVTGTGTVRVKATATGPSSSRALLTNPSAGSQRLLVGGLRESSSGVTSFKESPGQPTFESACDSDCYGNAPVTATFKNKADKRVRYVVRDKSTDKRVMKVELRSGRTISQTVTLHDGAKLVTSVCYLGSDGRCNGKMVELKGSFEVVCPPWVRAALELTCECDEDASTTVWFQAPGGVRYYTGYVKVNGTVKTVKLSNGAAKTLDAGELQPGDTLEVGFTAYRKSDYRGKLMRVELRSITINS